jgi:hypothetical protein
MQRAGMAFQSHGHEHVDLSRLPVAPSSTRCESQARLDGLGTAVEFLVAPRAPRPPGPRRAREQDTAPSAPRELAACPGAPLSGGSPFIATPGRADSAGS